MRTLLPTDNDKNAEENRAKCGGKNISDFVLNYQVPPIQLCQLF